FNMDVVSVSKPYQDHHAAEDKESTRFQHPIPNLHALLIGIDTYASVANLTGASKDADSVENFLRSDLSVPSTQITNLRNEQATRSGFLAAFDGLRRNPNIVPLDPILIYYAGHGCEVDTPSTDWGNYDEKTQCLVPWDVGTKDAAGNPIPPIPDYTIAALLYALAAEKGDNITVIFDCCHAASSTRGITHPGSKAKLPKWKIGYHSIPNSKMIAYRARRLDPKDLPRLTGETDVEILRKHARMYAHPKVVQPDSQRMRTSYDQPPSGPRRFGRSHILLAACAHAEIAYECTTSDRGYFTAALLQRLRSSRIHKLTYKTCFEDFPQLITPSLQSPVCEGDAGRLFFSSAVPKGYRDFVPIQQLAEGYTIKAGIAQGVIPGSVYCIWYEMMPSVGSHSPTTSSRLTRIRRHAEPLRLIPAQSKSFILVSHAAIFTNMRLFQAVPERNYFYEDIHTVSRSFLPMHSRTNYPWDRPWGPNKELSRWTRRADPKLFWISMKKRGE
ncbi:hypothetical protein RSAG8_11814, partial [Rhizoctonia solani AG-8 WAC10335]